MLVAVVLIATGLLVVRITGLLFCSLAVVLGFVCCMLYLYSVQDKYLYVPGTERTKALLRHRPLQQPSTWNLPHQDIFFPSLDGTKLHGWLILQPNQKQHPSPTLLFCHGNAGNINCRLSNYVGLFVKVGFNIFAFDYRGYGQSEGLPSQTGLLSDAEAALAWLQRHPAVCQDSIYVFGRSLGGAVALALAAGTSIRVRGLIVENTFLSVASMAVKLFPLRLCRVPSVLVEPLLRSKWRNTAKMKAAGAAAPILFISSSNDRVLPPCHMKELYAIAEQGNPGKHSWFSAQAGHNNAFTATGYYDAIIRFLSTCEPTLRDRMGKRDHAAMQDIVRGIPIGGLL